MSVAGTRPEIIKMSPVLSALEKEKEVENIFVYSGQHYDKEMAQVFLDELNLPKFDLNLKVGSGSHADQISKMCLGLEKAISKCSPHMILAEGDTNTVVGASLISSKMHLPFGHVEAGLRCYDRMMPEETNRVIADHLAELCFAPTERSALNLLYEGISPKRILITGNTVVDVCLEYLDKTRQSEIVKKLGLERNSSIATVTLHRPENVDNPNRLKSIISALIELPELRIVFPIHPRTKKMLSSIGLYRKLEQSHHILLASPLSYFDFIALLSRSLMVLTDSGGVQEEALTLQVPCLTLRYSTERPETVAAGGNIIIGNKKEKIVSTVRKLLAYPGILKSMKFESNPLGDGKAGERIARLCLDWCRKGKGIESPEYYESGSAEYELMKVSGKISGYSVNSLESAHEGLVVTSVFDASGRPVFPSSGLILTEGGMIRLFGAPTSIKKIKAES